MLMLKREKKPLSPKQSGEPRNKREMILKEASSLFAQFGFKAATMDMLAERLSLTKPTLYHYAKSKSVFFSEIMLDVMHKSRAICEEASHETSATGAMRKLIAGIIKLEEEDPNAFKTYYQESSYCEEYLDADQFREIRAGERFVMKTVYATIQRGIDDDEFRQCDVRTVGRLLISMILSPSRWPEQRVDFEAARVAACEVVLNGIVRPR